MNNLQQTGDSIVTSDVSIEFFSWYFAGVIITVINHRSQSRFQVLKFRNGSYHHLHDNCILQEKHHNDLQEANYKSEFYITNYIRFF